MSNDAMQDFFGPFPGRPDHPDFWKLSEVVLSLDAPADEVGASALLDACTKVPIDLDTVMYMATQRASRVYGASLAGLVAGLWIDGFMAGERYSRRYGHADDVRS